MSTRILILKDGVIKPGTSSDISLVDLTSNQTIGGNKTFTGTISGITPLMVGLGNVNNTSDINKPVSTATQSALNLKANLSSPNFTDIPTVPTASNGTNTTQIANTAFVSTAIANLVASSPSTLDTLNELATALGNDPNFATTISTLLGLKANIASPTFTGNVGFSGTLSLPTTTGTTIGTIWRNGSNLEFKDTSNVTQIILNSAGNLSNLSDKQLSLNNLVGAVTSGSYLRGNGTNVVLSAIQASDVPTLNQNTTGTASNITGITTIANGGTGSNTKNFVDLTTNQTIAGIKTFSDTTESTSTTTGSNIYLGGVAITKNLAVGGRIIQSINYTFKGAASVLQAIPNAVFTKVTLNSEINDTNNQYNPTLSRLTAVTSEVWQLSLYITLRLTASTRILLSVFKNGTEVGGISRILDTVANTGDFGINLYIPEFSLVVNDYLEVYCYATPSINVFGDSSLNTVFWSGKRIN